VDTISLINWHYRSEVMINMVKNIPPWQFGPNPKEGANWENFNGRINLRRGNLLRLCSLGNLLEFRIFRVFNPLPRMVNGIRIIGITLPNRKSFQIN